MAAENKPTNPNNKGGGKHRKQFLPHNRSVKKKGHYPLIPGVEGFFITCDGGRERQASHEAINVIDSFFEELVYGDKKPASLPDKPKNKKITFTYSDDDNDDDDDEDGDEEGELEPVSTEVGSKLTEKEIVPEKNGEEKKGQKTHSCEDKSSDENQISNKLNEIEEKTADGNANGKKKEENQDNEAVVEPPAKKHCVETSASKVEEKSGDKLIEAVEPPAKKQCVEMSAPKVEEKSIDKLIEAELKELGDKTKRRFSNLDSGCNGVVFIQMRKREGDPGPKDIAQFMMTSAASTRKHMSRFILRVLPIEVSCYASDEEITRAIKPLIEQHFPIETENPQKFAVLYESRSNTGIDRAKIINAVAKPVPAPHKVDLNNPDKTIIVEIVKTVCLIGIVEKYKELAKFNLRQLTSPK